MEPFIKFFIKIGKLKTVRRRGWLLRGVKNPETVADHAFRVLILAWVLGRQTNLKIKRLLKLAMVHSLSAVDIDYISPYDKLLDIKNKNELIKKYPALVLRAPVTIKGEIAVQRFEEEEKAVNRLTKNLPDTIRREVRYIWLDFQHKTSREAKFLWVIDKLENLIQALEYKPQLKKDLLQPFLQQIREITSDKKILRFVESLNEYFTEGKDSARNHKDKKLIKFILEVGKLKSMPRKGWVLRGVKNPESIATHSFVSALMSWLFSTRRRFDQEAIIVMLLVHDLFAVRTGDATPYDHVLRREPNITKLIKTSPWVGSKGEKELVAKRKLEHEARELDRLLKLLPRDIRHELKFFWLEYKTGTSREGRYARQVDRVETLLQALEYQKKDKNISIISFWLELKELLDDPILSDLVEEIDSYYYRGIT